MYVPVIRVQTELLEEEAMVEFKTLFREINN